MRHDSVHTGVHEQAHIDISDEDQVAEWAETFGVTIGLLRSAVAVVGNWPSRVRSYLRARR
jgi:hypothetical protein